MYAFRSKNIVKLTTSDKEEAIRFKASEIEIGRNYIEGKDLTKNKKTEQQSLLHILLLCRILMKINQLLTLVID